MFSWCFAAAMLSDSSLIFLCYNILILIFLMHNKNWVEKSEGRISKKTLKKQIDEGIDAARNDKKNRILASLQEKVIEVDAPQKALTGRKPDDYATESCVDLQELFPEEGEILNIGDPWQTLDLPGVTSIDYESGEEAEFVHDVAGFLSELDSRMAGIMEESASVRTDSNLIDVLADFMDKLANADENDFDRLGDLLLEISNNYVNNAGTGDDYLSLSFKNIWYELQRIGRGLKDVWLTKFVIEPTIKTEVLAELKRGKTLSPERIDDIKQRIITESRFVPKTKHAKMIKATFPNDVFEDNSFDRIIASWSLSTHMFPVMETGEFAIYWEEIDRLLKKDGACYMWPIYQGNEWSLYHSLLNYHRRGGDACVISFDEEGKLNIDWIGDKYFFQGIEESQTLIVFPKHAPDSSKKRVLNSIGKLNTD